MGFFISSSPPPTTQVSMVNMIFYASSDMSKGKAIVETPSMSLPKALYDAIQFASHAYINDHHLVASDPYHMPYWLYSPLPTISYKLSYRTSLFCFDNRLSSQSS